MVTATRSPDLAYEIDPKVQEKLLTFAPGKWVALTPDEIVAVRDSSTEAYEAARQLGVNAPIIFEVPTGDPGSYYY